MNPLVPTTPTRVPAASAIVHARSRRTIPASSSTAASPYAAAFFALVERLGVVESPRSG